MGKTQRNLMQATPEITSKAPRIRPGVMERTSSPIHPWWSISMLESNIPPTMADRKTPAPSLGVSTAPASTIKAPSGPPIQFHHGVERITSSGGGDGLNRSRSVTAVTMVPQTLKMQGTIGH